MCTKEKKVESFEFKKYQQGDNKLNCLFNDSNNQGNKDCFYVLVQSPSAL